MIIDILKYAAIFFALNLVYLYFAPTDSTDKSWYNRSGLSVYTDQATGVQYVKAGMFGDLTPRLNADGTPYKETK